MIVFPSLSPLTTTENGPPPDVRDTQKEAKKTRKLDGDCRVLRERRYPSPPPSSRFQFFSAPLSLFLPLSRLALSFAPSLLKGEGIRESIFPSRFNSSSFSIPPIPVRPSRP